MQYCPMLREVGIFLWNSVRHWMTVATGTVVSVGFIAWDFYSNGAAPIPRETVILVFPAATLLVGVFQAWREERNGRLRAELALANASAGKPRATLELVAENGKLFADITNHAAQATFELRLTAPQLAGNISSVPGIWQSGGGQRGRVITRGETQRVWLALYSEDDETERTGRPLTYAWMIYYLVGDDWQNVSSDAQSPDKAPPLELSLTLLSEPELAEPLQTKLKLSHREVTDSRGKELAVPPAKKAVRAGFKKIQR
jgi:hypothetical protein